MPPLVFHPVTNTVEVVAKAQRNGQRREWVFHYNYRDATPTVADLDALLLDIDNSIIGPTGAPTFVVRGTTWFELTARDINIPAGAFTSRAVSKQGVFDADPFPGNVSLCMTKRTGIAAKWARGRLYLFDMKEDFFNGDELNLAYLPILTLFANHLLATRNGGQFIPAVASKTRGFSNILTAITWDFTADSQRRRLTGRGI